MVYIVGDALSQDDRNGNDRLRSGQEDSEQVKNNKTTAIAVSTFVAGLLLTVFALLYSNTRGGNGSGMMGGTTNNMYSVTNMLLAVIGSFLMAIGLCIAVFKEDYEPLTDPTPIQAPIIRPAKVVQQASPVEEKAPEPLAEPARNPEVGSPIDDRRLVLRLLTGDERTVFRAIVDSGGEALQKDLIVKTNMSDAKVSRTLDKLVEKGVVSKTRHGMTNRVRVEIEP